MKKLIALVLALVLCLSLVACGGDDAVAEFVKDNKAQLISIMEDSIEQNSGGQMTCTADVVAKDSGLVITLKINEYDNLTDAEKASIQASTNAMRSGYETSLEMMQSDLPELRYAEYRLCEVDGDLISTIVVGKK